MLREMQGALLDSSLITHAKCCRSIESARGVSQAVHMSVPCEVMHEMHPAPIALGFAHGGPSGTHVPKTKT